MKCFLPILVLASACAAEADVVEHERPPVVVPAVVAPPVFDPCAPGVEELGVASDPRLWDDDVIVVRKAVRRLLHFEGGALSEGGCYRVGLGQGVDAAVGTKTRQGDLKTPEGWYRTSDKPTSRFRGAIAMHYPNADDATSGRRAGLLDDAQLAQVLGALARDEKPPQNTRLGGEILIHGGGSATDWTLGCVALDDADLDLLRARLPADQRFHILVVP